MRKMIVMLGFAAALVATGPTAAVEMCSTRQMGQAAGAINRHMKILVENAPVACAILKADMPGRCSVLCFSEYSMDQNQRRAVLVYLVGAAGLEINKIGAKNFEKIVYVDRDLARAGNGIAISAERLADLQHRAKADQIDAPHLIAEAMASYKLIPVKVPAK